MVLHAAARSDNAPALPAAGVAVPFPGAPALPDAADGDPEQALRAATTAAIASRNRSQMLILMSSPIYFSVAPASRVNTLTQARSLRIWPPDLRRKRSRQSHWRCPGMACQIAILHLDTDWYESTRHELQHLYPRLTSGGVLIVDD